MTKQADRVKNPERYRYSLLDVLTIRGRPQVVVDLCGAQCRHKQVALLVWEGRTQEFYVPLGADCMELLNEVLHAIRRRAVSQFTRRAEQEAEEAIVAKEACDRD